MVMWGAKRAKALSEELYPGVDGIACDRVRGVALAILPPAGHQARADVTQGRAARACRFHDCFDYRRRYPDGRIGSDPSLSTPEHGERIYNAAVEDMVEAYQAFMA